MKMWSMVIVFALGFAIAYYMPNLGDMTIGKLYAR